jgi:hypothetical protein
VERARATADDSGAQGFAAARLVRVAKAVFLDRPFRSTLGKEENGNCVCGTRADTSACSCRHSLLWHVSCCQGQQARKSIERVLEKDTESV